MASQGRASLLPQRLQDLLPSTGAAWLQAVRMRGAVMVSQNGLPTPRLERWKYTNLERAVAAIDLPVLQTEGYRCGDPGFVVQPLADLLNNPPSWVRDLIEHPGEGGDYGMTALRHINEAFLNHGTVIDVPAGFTGAAPLTLDLNADGQSFLALRLIIRVGAGALLTVLETQDGTGSYWKNGMTQIVLGEGAVLRHVRIQDDSAEAVNTQITHIRQERDSRYDGFTLTTGARLSRNQIHAVLEGAGAECRLNGVMLQRGRQHGDTTMLVEHAAPHCNSSQLLRTVLDDQAHGVYQGKVFVHRAAQKTDGYQLANTILLSEGTEMDTKPELEIYADDVKCSHGATTGRLDEEPLFYMRSRGISEAQARALMIESFLAQALERIGDESIRTQLAERVSRWLK